MGAQKSLTLDMSEEEQLIAAAATVIICGYQHKRRRRFWIRPSLTLGSVHREMLYKNMVLDDEGLLPEEIRDSGTFINFVRMCASDFEVLLTKIAPAIVKENTAMRNAVTPADRLLVTLRYLATGDSYRSLSYMFKISNQLISQIVPEVCSALISALCEYVKVRNRN